MILIPINDLGLNIIIIIDISRVLHSQPEDIYTNFGLKFEKCLLQGCD